MLIGTAPFPMGKMIQIRLTQNSRELELNNRQIISLISSRSFKCLNLKIDSMKTKHHDFPIKSDWTFLFLALTATAKWLTGNQNDPYSPFLWRKQNFFFFDFFWAFFPLFLDFCLLFYSIKSFAVTKRVYKAAPNYVS